MKPQRKNAGGRKSEHHSNHPQSKPSSVQSAVGCAHHESVSTATNERARFDHQSSPKSSSARNEPSLIITFYGCYIHEKDQKHVLSDWCVFKRYLSQ